MPRLKSCKWSTYSQTTNAISSATPRATMNVQNSNHQCSEEPHFSRNGERTSKSRFPFALIPLRTGERSYKNCRNCFDGILTLKAPALPDSARTKTAWRKFYVHY